MYWSVFPALLLQNHTNETQNIVIYVTRKLSPTFLSRTVTCFRLYEESSIQKCTNNLFQNGKGTCLTKDKSMGGTFPSHLRI